MMELNREQIVQALEYCTGIKSVDACANCPACLGCNDCVDFLREKSLALIKELIKENENLNKRLDREAKCQYDLCGQIVNLRDDVKYIKADTVRKMQDRIKAKAYTNNYCQEVVLESDIDQIAKEILEENK